ncbi:unnamed protein product [Phaedon cochleariae]|uniref:CCHC-type domain-containing protein n=1 Tax=Phaedon cochleariae TaxID=80249 RepID=A0A9N9X432_PHACE|nr:unnamed protein product [Phaedon cochleariae]
MKPNFIRKTTRFSTVYQKWDSDSALDGKMRKFDPKIVIFLLAAAISLHVGPVRMPYGDTTDKSDGNILVQDFEDFYALNHPQQATPASAPTGNRNEDMNFNMNLMMKAMNAMLRQNAVLIKNLMERAEKNYVQNYNIMPDFSKSISVFTGEDLNRSQHWLSSLEAAATLHHWPSAFMLETARTHLVGAAFHWYEARKSSLTNWPAFREESKGTFVHERQLTSLWKEMTSRVQGPKDDLSTYLHEKVKLCSQLLLDFEKQKDQIAFGLQSRELASMIVSKTHIDIDDLFRDLVRYEELNWERRQRQPHDRTQQQSRGEERTSLSREVLRCFNCNGAGHVVNSCRKPKREEGSCSICGSTQHQQRTCLKEGTVPSTMATQVSTLKVNDLKILKKEFSDVNETKFALLTRKGVFPYDYVDNVERLDESELPSIQNFYNKLNDTNISDDDYAHARKVWESFELKSLGEYSDLYMRTDILLLADVMENFRASSLKTYGLDPAWYYTMPGYTWDCMLKYTGCKLQIIKDIDMVMFVEQAIRGGVSNISSTKKSLVDLPMKLTEKPDGISTGFDCASAR